MTCCPPAPLALKVSHSISAGLDYSAVGPEHSFLRGQKKVNYVYVTDKQCMVAVNLLSKTEGIIPALESAHALAYVNNNHFLIQYNQGVIK